MRWRGLAQPRGTVPLISQRPLRRSTTYQGQERSRSLRSTGSPVARGLPAPVAQAFLFANKPGFPPSRAAPSISLSRWLRAFFSPNDRGFPQVKRLKFSLRRVAQSFLLLTRLGVSPPPYNLKFSLSPGGPELSSPHMTRGFPSATNLEVFPAPLARGPPCGSPLPGGTGLSPGPEAPEFAQYRVARGFPAPVARSFLLAGGAGLLLARRPGVALCRVARGFPFAGYRPWW